MGRLCTGFLLWAVLTPTIRAADALPIHDDAKLFSPDAISRATDLIVDFQETAHFGFLLETTKTLPDEVVDSLNRASNAHRAFSDYAEERAQAADVRGVYVLISTMPKHSYIGVVVRPEEYEASFSDRQREQLRKLLASKLKKHPDEALLKAVNMVRDDVRESRKEAKSWLGFGAIAALIGGLLVLWMLLGLIRMWLQVGTSAAPVPGTEAPARPGIVPGLLGGMFGSVAGHWIYDKFFEEPAASQRMTALPPQKPAASAEKSEPNNAGS